jgi:hypothetical protein
MEEDALYRRTDPQYAEADGICRKVDSLAGEMAVSEATLYTWKSKYGGVEINEAQAVAGSWKTRIGA